jgi:hypothetical protein
MNKAAKHIRVVIRRSYLLHTRVEKMSAQVCIDERLNLRTLPCIVTPPEEHFLVAELLDVFAQLRKHGNTHSTQYRHVREMHTSAEKAENAPCVNQCHRMYHP